MPHNPIRVIVGPANYFSHPESFDHLHDFFTDEQLSHAVRIYGERAIAAAQTKLPPAFGLSGTKHTLFRGRYNKSDVQQLATKSSDDRNVVIGVGGGVLLDTTKTLAHRLGPPSVAVPTTTATCATWVPLSVWYNDAEQALHYEIFSDANFMVLVEPEITLNVPRQYLLAGIDDALAKWYEAVVLAPQSETLPLTMRLRINSAQAIRNVLLSSSEQALSNQQNQQLTQSFCDVADAIIASGGMVGGLGGRFTCVAAAHAVYNGLTTLPQAEKSLHGAKAACEILM